MKRNLLPKNIQFTAPQLEWLEAQAKELGISVAELTRRVIDEYRGMKIVGWVREDDTK